MFFTRFSIGRLENAAKAGLPTHQINLIPHIRRFSALRTKNEQKSNEKHFRNSIASRDRGPIDDDENLVPANGEGKTRGLMEPSPLFPQAACCFFSLLLGTVVYDKRDGCVETRSES
jgi:hypothetical protein